MDIRISYLAERPELAAGLIPGLLDHWRPIFPDQTYADREAKFRAHLNRDRLPIAWVAHEDDTVLGTAALRVHDLESRTDLTPWLAGVYVLPQYRRRGIASALCRTVASAAAAMGYQRIYLFTLDQVPLYTGLGWVSYASDAWHGRRCEIMVKNL